MSHFLLYPIETLADAPIPRSVQSALKNLEAIGLLQHFPPLKDPQYQLPNRYILKK